jgi:hypothetical protein
MAGSACLVGWLWLAGFNVYLQSCCPYFVLRSLQQCLLLIAIHRTGFFLIWNTVM